MSPCTLSTLGDEETEACELRLDRLLMQVAGCRPPSLCFNVKLRSVFSGQRGASDAEDEDEHPERLSAQVRLIHQAVCAFL